MITQKNSAFDQNYTKLSMETADEELDVLGLGESTAEEAVDSDSTDIDGYDHLPDNSTDYELDTSDDSCNYIRNFKEESLNKLYNTNLLDELIEILSDSGQLIDFMDLLEHIRNKAIPCTNIVFVLLLERARFQSCMNTVGMRYSELTKKFWSIVYRLCKGVGLKFFSGEKNWGQVVTKKSQKSRYRPDMSKINFAVPDEKILRDYNKVLPKVIPPGKIAAGLNLLSGKDDIVIMGDGKLIAKGLKMNFEGDINLFCHEDNPNLQKLITELKDKLEFVGKN